MEIGKVKCTWKVWQRCTKEWRPSFIYYICVWMSIYGMSSRLLGDAEEFGSSAIGISGSIRDVFLLRWCLGREFRKLKCGKNKIANGFSYMLTSAQHIIWDYHCDRCEEAESFGSIILAFSYRLWDFVKFHLRSFFIRWMTSNKLFYEAAHSQMDHFQKNW